MSWQIFSRALEVLDRKLYETEEAARDEAAAANTRNPLGRWIAVASVPANQQSTIFRDHNCWKCRDGEKPCAQGHPHRCEYPHAKND